MTSFTEKWFYREGEDQHFARHITHLGPDGKGWERETPILL